MASTVSTDFPQEIELKFQIPTTTDYEALLVLTQIGQYALINKGERNGEDVYFDTSDRAILRAGYACRIRPKPSVGFIATLKTLDGGAETSQGLHQRAELEVDLSEFLPPNSWPASPARDAVLELVGNETLEKLAQINQTRHIREAQKDQRAVAEITFDVVNFQNDDKPVHLMEIELAKSGALDDLNALGALFQHQFPALIPENRSKLAIALALEANNLQPTTNKKTNGKNSKFPAIRRDDHMSEAGRKVLLLHFQRMIRGEKEVRLGEDNEAVHAMRVAVRRQRAALKVFAPYFKKDSLKPFSRQLRRTGRALGAVRDFDVLIEKLDRHMTEIPDLRDESLSALREVWQRQRDEARKDLLNFLDSERQRAFKTEFAEFLETPFFEAKSVETKTPTRALVCHILSSAIWFDYESVRAYEWVMDRASLETLHDLRISIKGLRYLLEFFKSVLGNDAETVVRELVQAQDLLGELHDADVTAQLLCDFLTQKSNLPIARARELPEMRGVINYLALQEKQIGILRRRVGSLWKRLNHQRLRRQLALAVAQV